MASASSSMTRLLAAANTVREISAPYATTPHAVLLTGLKGVFPLPDDSAILPPSIVPTLSGQTRATIVTRTQERLAYLRTSVTTSLNQTLGKTASVEDLGGCSDARLEQMVIATFEAGYERGVEKILSFVRTAARQLEDAEQTSSAKKSNGFDPQTITILESAFSRSPNLTQRECAIVAETAKITHQQVRTWFQNKRNRKRTGERRTASVSEVQPRITDVIPEPRRVISALPKRATKPEALQQPPPPPQHLSSIRPIRSLPRRGNHASTSPTPSYESTSSLDSIQPSGGFISPLDLLHPPQPVEAAHNPSLYLPVDGGAPLFNFTPPTPLNVAFGNADMGFNIDEILPPWSNDDFTELLNSVLANPTLAGSPVFTSLSVASPESLGSKKSQTPEWTGQELGEDFFAALDGLLGSPGNAIAPESEGSGTPLSLNTTDLTTASNSAEISPVTTIGPYAMIQTPHNLTTDTAETTDVCPLTTSTSTSSSSGNTTPIDALHPFIPPTILNPGTESTYSDSERWTSGVLAFDCGGAEWQGYDEKFVLGGDWDFSGMLEGVEA